jgi:tetratricopeptide (TPR) repeat protein/DNA-binding SARP family transcriptional activator
MTMIYRLLGELEVGQEGRSIELPAGITLIVLADLLMHANKRVSKLDLIRTAWGKDDVDEAQLHKRVGDVRALLGQVGRRGDLKNHPRFGYELCVAVDDVDVLVFRRLLLQAEDARNAGPGSGPGDEKGLLRQALRLWRGAKPLSNVPSDAFHQEVLGLERRRKVAASRLFDLELAHGRHEHIMGELEAIAGLYPADPRLTGQFMVAAHRCGHPADVIAAYERYVVALRDETDGLPDPPLQAFYYAIGRGDEAAIASAESDLAKHAETPAGPAVLVPRQLPPAPDLVGRRDLVAETSARLSDPSARTVPVVVISGPGGIGKTALAVAVAHESAARFPDGQLYAELRGSAGPPVDSAEILAQFLRALGAPRVPESKQERLALYRSLLARRQVLVVLDDAAGDQQVSDLVPAEPGCAVLVTGRRRLPGAASWHVPTLRALELKDATELFLHVLRGAGIGLDDDPAAVDRVVELCDGLPLALRIAGALRVRDHPRTTADLAARLARQGPEAFAYGELDVARTIGAGFDLLGARARQLFLGLGLLPLPRFAHWTAAALLDGDAADAADVLHQLTASFMVEHVGPGLRYGFHDLTRDYAGRRARAQYPGPRDEVPARAYRALLTLARRAHARLYGGDFEVVHSAVPDWDAPPEVLDEVDAAPLDWFEQERDNIRVAVGETARLGLTGLCWDLAFTAHEFYTVRAYFDDWRATAATALRACQDGDDRYGEAMMLVCLSQPALVASGQGRTSAVAGLRRAVGLLAEFEDKHGLAIAQRTLANALRRQGHLAEPLALFCEALANYAASEDAVGCWQALRLIGQTYLDLGRHDDARRLLAEAEDAAVRLGDGRLLAQTRYWIGQAGLAAGDLDGARAAFGFVFDVCQGTGGSGLAYALHGMGEAECRTGAYEAAQRRLSEAASLAREGEDALLQGRVWMSVAELRQRQGQGDGQLAALREAKEVFAGRGAVHLEAWALRELARALRERGDAGAAAAALDGLERLYQEARVPQEDRVYQNA